MSGLLEMGISPAGEVLCQQRQSTQSAAGGGHARFHRAIRAAPRPPMRGKRLNVGAQKTSRRGKRHRLRSVFHSLPLCVEKLVLATPLKMRLLRTGPRLVPEAKTAPRFCIPRRDCIESSEKPIKPCRAAAGGRRKCSPAFVRAEQVWGGLHIERSGTGPAGPGDFGYFPPLESSPPADGISPLLGKTNPKPNEVRFDDVSRETITHPPRGEGWVERYITLRLSGCGW